MQVHRFTVKRINNEEASFYLLISLIADKKKQIKK